ncbi:two-component response regulator ARR2-like, partial [Trifolium medium]|nr:two-component response regulator ARR2-like [Trifolium medium]
ATATLASEALSVIGEKKNEINLVLVEAQLPDMEIYEFVTKMKSSNISSFIITAYDDDIPSISQALRTGAKWCFRKPVRISDLQQLWRFAVWNRFEPTISEEVFDYRWPLSEVVTNGLEYQPSLNTGEQSVESVNGKAQESFDNKDTIVLLKTRRRTWTDDLHRKFLDAVQTAGINAPPKTIFELMDVEGLKKGTVSNYLKADLGQLVCEAPTIGDLLLQ